MGRTNSGDEDGTEQHARPGDAANAAEAVTAGEDAAKAVGATEAADAGAAAAKAAQATGAANAAEATGAAKAAGAENDRRPAAAPGRAMNTFSPADEEKRRGVRRMKATATGLLLFVALVYVLAKWASDGARAPGPAMSRRPPRRAWSARWPTGSRSRPSSGTRSACPSRTQRSSPRRRISWASRWASSSARTSSPRTSSASGCARWASAADWAPGSPIPNTRTGSRPNWPPRSEAR